ncbi:hypothetical protein GAYE_SCF68G6910 [Galdieria yellowstonensis]|uniref:Uncharacterized protein n=1 Tax=Galdieria yellowstonensis TaxID=3028027 RepID=A0AAV9IP76_9RHOD|nr:hypothetical protein GAYE_SCF68G6910 [Galdieria yellowstonensis]
MKVNDNHLANQLQYPFPGIHGYNLVGCWDHVHCEKASKIASQIDDSLVKVFVIDPLFDTQTTKQLADKYGLRLSCSVGLSQDTDITSLDESTRKRGERVLMSRWKESMLLALRLFVDLFVAKWENYSLASTQPNVSNNVEMLRRVAQKA